MSLNKVFLIGNLGQTPELKTTSGGKPYCRINLATHERYVQSTGEEIEKTTWHSVHVFGKQAEWACSRLLKGSRIFVEARMERSEETAEDGKKMCSIF